MTVELAETTSVGLWRSMLQMSLWKSWQRSRVIGFLRVKNDSFSDGPLSSIDWDSNDILIQSGYHCEVISEGPQSGRMETIVVCKLCAWGFHRDRWWRRPKHVSPVTNNWWFLSSFQFVGVGGKYRVVHRWVIRLEMYGSPCLVSSTGFPTLHRPTQRTLSALDGPMSLVSRIIWCHV